MTLGREIGLGEGNGTMGVEQEEWRFEKVKRKEGLQEYTSNATKQGYGVFY